MSLSVEQFLSLSDAEQLQTIKDLNDIGQEEVIIDVLTGVGTDNLSVPLLGELGRAYNNNDKPEEAIKVFKDTNNSLYFIIILSQNTVDTKIGRIKNTNTTDYKSIILLTKKIKYEKLFSGHLELYGAIDLAEDLDVLMKEINEYLTEWLKFTTKSL